MNINKNVLEEIYQKNKLYLPILSKYNKTLSIGSTCFIKKFMLSIGINQETEFFDYIGVPVWSITDLIHNDFKNLFNYHDYKNIKILSDKDDSYNITHIPYFLVFKHDFSQTHKQFTFPIKLPEFNRFNDKYLRRSIRFQNLLHTSSSILFIRYEQYKNYIIHDQYKDKYEKCELSQLRDFSLMLKEKYPHLHFNILFFYSNIENSFYDNDYNILILKNTQGLSIGGTPDGISKTFTYDNCHEKLHEICVENMDLLNKYL